MLEAYQNSTRYDRRRVMKHHLQPISVSERQDPGTFINELDHLRTNSWEWAKISTKVFCLILFWRVFRTGTLGSSNAQQLTTIVGRSKLSSQCAMCMRIVGLLRESKGREPASVFTTTSSILVTSSYCHTSVH